jgi:hypothetical protein
MDGQNTIVASRPLYAAYFVFLALLLDYAAVKILSETGNEIYISYLKNYSSL